MSEPRLNSILAADFGSVNTRALLFDKVDGAFRLVGQGSGLTAIGAPPDDALAGLAATLETMNATSGRQLLDDKGKVIRPQRDGRVGVDYFLTTTSAGPPLRVALIGLYPQVSIAAARRAIAPFYADAVAEVHLEDGLSARGRLNRLIHSEPQLIFITGGTDGGARAVLLEMLALAREAVSLMTAGNRPVVLYAGNSSLQASALEMLSQQVEVLIAPNIRQAGGEALDGAQAALGRYFEGLKRRSGGFQGAASSSDSGLVATARGLETMTAFFGRSLEQDALTIDFGSARTTLSLARKGGLHTVIRNDIGAGHSARSALELVGEEEAARWLPFKAGKGELADYARKKETRPASLPLDMRERTIENAFLRSGLRFAARELTALDRSQVGLVALAGATFAGAGQGALDMLLLADALQLEGVTRVKADPQGALPALGALAAVAPAAVVQLVNGGVLEQVGALIRVSGRAAAGEAALKVAATGDKGDSVEREVRAGDIWHLPAAGTVDLRIQTRRGLSIGGRRRLRLKLRGGRGGLLIDARLEAPSSAVNLLRWYAAATGRGRPVAIPESWLAGDSE